MIGPLFLSIVLAIPVASTAQSDPQPVPTLNAKDTGYRGIWYMNQPLDNEYRFKYSGGLGTYCAKHRPFAAYSEKVNKTFFCYGGTTEDSYLKHDLTKADGKDAHDNPVISIDDRGYLWIFSTPHGTSRPSYIHRSKEPYRIDEFERVPARKIEDGNEVPMTNFSYVQPWFVPGRGFAASFTRDNYPVACPAA